MGKMAKNARGPMSSVFEKHNICTYQSSYSHVDGLCLTSIALWEPWNSHHEFAVALPHMQRYLVFIVIIFWFRTVALLPLRPD